MADDEQQRWDGHPWMARLVRLAVFAIPFASATATAIILSSRLPRPESFPAQVGRLIAIVAVATVVMGGVDRLARRLLPLSALLRLTLVFPDEAPSRFRIAMRTSGGDRLEERIAAAMTAREHETPNEAAERLLELVGLLSHHDRLTRGHSERVRVYTQVLGEEMGLTETELDKIRWAGLLHDVGKTAVPAAILNKPSGLTADELAVIRTHPEAGRELVQPLTAWLGESLRAVWEHHERWDGAGYPRGLAGTDISLGARIVAVADTFDVITSARSYKRPLPAADARAELARCAGTQFDPVVVRAFLNISLGRLRWMVGPAAWMTHLMIFEPVGVVRAGEAGSAQATGSAASGAASAGTGATTAIGAASSSAASSAGAASLGAAAVSTAATTGGSALLPTLALVGAGVVAGTTGITVADPVSPPRSETAIAEHYAPEVGTFTAAKFATTPAADGAGIDPGAPLHLEESQTSGPAASDPTDRPGGARPQELDDGLDGGPATGDLDPSAEDSSDTVRVDQNASSPSDDRGNPGQVGNGHDRAENRGDNRNDEAEHRPKSGAKDDNAGKDDGKNDNAGKDDDKKGASPDPDGPSDAAPDPEDDDANNGKDNGKDDATPAPSDDSAGNGKDDATPAPSDDGPGPEDDPGVAAPGPADDGPAPDPAADEAPPASDEVGEPGDEDDDNDEDDDD